jgi:hypothetical protein
MIPAGGKAQAASPPGPEWLRQRLGIDYFASVEYVQIGPRRAFEALIAVKQLGSLRDLRIDIDGTPLTHEQIELLASMRNVRRMQFFARQRTDVLREAVSRLPALEGLVLHRCNVDDQGVRHIATMAGMDALFFTDCQIGMNAASEICRMTSLRRLGLKDCRIGDDALPFIGRLTHLTFVNLAGTSVTDGGAASLKRELPECKVTR